MIIPEWFWTVDYLLAPFLVAGLLIVQNIWTFILTRRANRRHDALMERTAKALERMVVILGVGNDSHRR